MIRVISTVLVNINTNIMIHRFLVNRAVNGVSNGICGLVLVISVSHLEYHHDDDGVGDDGDGGDGGDDGDVGYENEI